MLQNTVFSIEAVISWGCEEQAPLHMKLQGQVAGQLEQ